MKAKFILFLCISFMSVFAIFTVLPVSGEEEIYDNMIRLHVLANSDSEEDQSLKLRVRDAVLEAVRDIDAADPADAYIKTENSLETLENVAKDEIKRAGYDYDVSVVLGSEKYPEREYDGFVLPAGTYTSLRVLIGEGAGQNWWCVLYPPLCTESASEREEVFIAAGFTGEQYKAITQSKNKKYKIKFKVIEIIKNIVD